MKNSRFSLRLLAFLLAFVALSAIVPLGGLALPAEAASAPLAAAAEGASVLEGVPNLHLCKILGGCIGKEGRALFGDAL